jgi:hypothetical protein
MRTICLAVLALFAVGCAKKEDPAPTSAPTAAPKSAQNEQGGGNPQAGTPYVPGAGPVSPVSGEGVEGGGSAAGQVAKDRAKQAAQRASGSSLDQAEGN